VRASMHAVPTSVTYARGLIRRLNNAKTRSIHVDVDLLDCKNMAKRVSELFGMHNGINMF
jgi:hypothetical protein